MDIYKLNFTILELEIFSYLCIKVGEELSQREIAIALKVSPTAVANAVRKLSEKELVKIKKTKTINFIVFNRDNPRAINLKRTENLRLLYNSGLTNFLEEKLAGSTIILFGSYSRGEDAKSSDIDIAVIGRKEKELKLKEYEKKLNKQIRVNFYESWKSIHRNLRNNILNGIILAGSAEL